MQRLDPAKALSTVPPPAPRTSSPTKTPTLTAVPSQPSAATLTRLWLLGIGAWGHRWVSALGELPIDDADNLTIAGALWARQLTGLKERDILAAIDHFAGRLDWPPSLAENRRQALGIPSFDVVRAQITAHATPFARMVWQYLDHWAFTRADQRDAERQLRNAYDQAVERRLAGDDLPDEPVAAIAQEAAPFVEATPEQARQRMADIAATLRGEGDAP